LLYPNPTTGILQVASDKLQITRIDIFDISGKKVSSHHLIPSSSPHLLNISHLPQGIYTVSIFSEGKVVGSRKVIKYY